MGERGPLPTLHARRRNKRPASGKTVAVARPRKPRTLAGEAAKEWDRIVPELEAMGVLATVDRAALVRYCTAWADWCDLNEKLAQTSKLVRGARGNLVRNPLWIMRGEVEQTLADLGRQLGLTPVARLRAGIVHEVPREESDSRTAAVMLQYREALSRTPGAREA